MSRTRLLLLAAICLACAAGGNFLAESYIDRLPNHAGYHLIPVEDSVPPATAAERPRHTVVVVVDGLRADHARPMRSAQRIAAVGQCRLTDVGPLSVSRPVYAVISTGLEQDRAGSRNNDETRPLAAQSIWQVARRAGLRVTGVSELPWFRQLFPDGFDDYRLIARADDAFTTPAPDLGDLALIHPIYVDEEGHDHGGSSAAYQAAAERADAELGRLLDRLDWSRDVVLLTADHGHLDRGGHGANSPEVRNVLTCVGGRGIVRRPSESPAIDSRMLAPLLAVILRVPFPRHLRAGDDVLDSVFEFVDPAVYPPAYLDLRRLAISRFRDENARARARLLGHAGSWGEVYAAGRRRQATRGLLFLAAVVALALVTRRYSAPPRPLPFVLWSVGTCLAIGLVYIAVRGSFDFDSMNARRDFIIGAAIASLVAGAASVALYLAILRDPVALVQDQVRLALLFAVVCVGHIVAFGWPLGFPLPGPTLLFLPFIAGSSLCFTALLGLGGCLFLALRRPPT